MAALSQQAKSGSRQVSDGPATEEHPAPRHPRLHALRERLHHRREKIRAKRGLNLAYRITLGVFGAIVLTAGVIMIPYPGPGWLIVFAGLGLLATEFHWAHRVNVFVKRYYERWAAWLRRQHTATKLTVAACTGLVVLATMWLIGFAHTAAGWFGMHWQWLASPLF